MKQAGSLRLGWALLSLLALAGCGSSTPTPVTPVTTQPPVTTPPPTTLPPFAALCGLPSPPPLIGMKVSVQTASGPARWRLDSKPIVKNVDGYCQAVGLDGKQCETRPEGSNQREACDALVVGKATDTGRVGPTWFSDFGACLPTEIGTQNGCINDTVNQFLAIAKGAGSYLACASNDWPLADGGSRCGGCTLKSGDMLCES
jgi:hypothetical protein